VVHWLSDLSTNLFSLFLSLSSFLFPNEVGITCCVLCRYVSVAYLMQDVLWMCRPPAYSRW
jgi:hypothetical protein